MDESENVPFDYEAVFASLTADDRQFLLEKYGVPLDAQRIIQGR